jgi:hypothetical protein
MLRESRTIAPVPWPLAPRPFDEEAFGSWLGRVVAKYRISIAVLWEMSVDEPIPLLENVGWIMFPRVGQNYPGSIIRARTIECRPTGPNSNTIGVDDAASLPPVLLQMPGVKRRGRRRSSLEA